MIKNFFCLIMQAHCSVISEASTTPSNSLLSGSVLSTSIEKSYLCSLSEKCFLGIHFMLSVLFLCHSLIFSDSPSGNHFPDTCLFSAGRRLSAGSRATLHTQRPPAALETWIHKQVVMVFLWLFLWLGASPGCNQMTERFTKQEISTENEKSVILCWQWNF